MGATNVLGGHVAEANGDRGLTVRELVLELRGDVKEISAKLDKKVDESDFVRLQGEVRELQLHGSSHAIEALKEASRVEERVSRLEELRGKLLGALTLIAAAAGVGTSVGLHYL